jgi:hypothetical protein
MARRKVSAQESERISELATRLGSVRFRTLLTGAGESDRLMRPERLANLQRGTGTLTEGEQERLQLVSGNIQLIQNLAQKNTAKRPYRVNRALKDWIANGKPKGVIQTDADKDKKLRAVKALGYLGIDPSEGTYYIRKRKS